MFFKVGHEYESRRCPIPSAAPRKYTDFNGVIGEGRSSISKISEVGGARLKLQDFRSGGFEGAVKIHSSDQLNAARSILQACIDSAGQNTYLQHGAYENVNAKQGSYQTMNTQQRPYQMKARQSPYELSAQQGAYNTNAPLPKVPTNTNYSFSSILSFSENSSSHFVQHNANINTFLNAIIA
ncbi:hypothetical protein TIFTF001_026213 [Ficus carica]|uniref:Uncharacterized protein n=1 Tax=Ficus carica TaxID=3494 RepID=A0AA88DKT7_FICCA|nr:hypothetical protein TIFTF001_026213 [Ficus carica]